MRWWRFLWIAVSVGATAPLTPALCDSDTPGNCDCGILEPGFAAYSWILQDGCRVCFLQYVPPSASKPMKVHLAIGDSIRSTTDGERSWKTTADAYGFAVFQVRKETLWDFGNDGMVNLTNPMPCSNLDSRDIPFLSAIFDHIKGAKNLFLQGKATVGGFSIHSMFAAYVALCFHEDVVGVAQGGSGLVVKGSFPPRVETACSQSSFASHGENCTVKDPCSFCEVWPMYPCQTPTPMVDCLFTYGSDFLAGTADSMYAALAAEGHDARMFKFGGSRGHSWPLNHKDWIAGCLGLGTGGPCSATCTNSFVVCMLEGSSFSDCMQRKISLSGCTSKCSPSYGMMMRSETPSSSKRTVEGAWGEPTGQQVQTSSSRCSANASAAVRNSSGTGQAATCFQGQVETERQASTQEYFRCGTQRMIDTRHSATGGVCMPTSDGSSSQCCGDGVCDGPETACYCPDDCTGRLCMRAANAASFRTDYACTATRDQQCCGDGKCNGPETAALCPVDCNGNLDGRGGYCDGLQGFIGGSGIPRQGVWNIPLETSTTTTIATTTRSRAATVLATSTSTPACECSCMIGSLLAALFFFHP